MNLSNQLHVLLISKIYKARRLVEILIFSSFLSTWFSMSLLETPLCSFHAEHGALMTDFAGWRMPLWYEGIIPEHLAVRDNVGLFDVSHMGRLLVKGVNAEKTIDYLATNNVRALQIGGAQYTPICNDNGGIKDDVIVYKIQQDEFLIVTNSVNRLKIYNWINEHLKPNVEVNDLTFNILMLSLQGPKSVNVLNDLGYLNVQGLQRFSFIIDRFNDSKLLIAYTGYTGERGYELMLWLPKDSEREVSEEFTSRLIDTGVKYGLKLCGLGARDTLRLEAGMVLYGNDIDENTTPIEAKLSFTVKLDKGDFIGRKILEEQRRTGVKRVRIGFICEGRQIPRRDYKIYYEGVEVGVVTSGSYSPILQRGIGMGYISPSLDKPGLSINIPMRIHTATAVITKWPFYDTRRYGYMRVE